jgi:hypothetical protein
MIETKISFDEIVKLIENKYQIKNVKFIKNYGYDGDSEFGDLPDYAIGETKDFTIKDRIV